MRDGFLQKVRPDPALREYISQYTFVDMPFEQVRHNDFKVMPASHTRMVFFLGESSLHKTDQALQRLEPYSLTGFISKPQTFLPTSHLRQVFVHFTTWGIQPFLDFPLAEITDSRADVRQLFPQYWEKLCEALHRSPTVATRTVVLNRFFTDRLSGVRQVDRRAKLLTQHILQTHGSVRLKDLSDRFFLGQRTIQRLVQNTIGVNYKFFARIARLEYVRQLLSRSNCSLTDVALRAGYFDQAHFIHDFQETFGESPGQYLARQRRQQLIWNQLDTYRALPETG